MKLTIWGYEFSEGEGELNSQKGLDSWGLPCFSANVLTICITMYILISLISEESMTESESRIYDTKRSWPYLAIQP